jgi:hypothetical protein
MNFDRKDLNVSVAAFLDGDKIRLSLSVQADLSVDREELSKHGQADVQAVRVVEAIQEALDSQLYEPLRRHLGTLTKRTS